MNILKSKNYPRIMYLALIVVSLLILFTMVNILDTANEKFHHRLTGFAVSENGKINNSDSNITGNNDEKNNSEIYTSKPYIIFYIFIVGILVAIVLTFFILSSTIKKNIDEEEKARKF